MYKPLTVTRGDFERSSTLHHRTVTGLSYVHRTHMKIVHLAATTNAYKQDRIKTYFNGWSQIPSKGKTMFIFSPKTVKSSSDIKNKVTQSKVIVTTMFIQKE